MVVRTQQNGHEVVGLMVGATNVRRYFPRAVKAVSLRLGDLEIECKLSPEFWHGKPEIQDPRLREWLQFRHSQARLDREAFVLAMEHSGDASYTLQALGPQLNGTIRDMDS